MSDRLPCVLALALVIGCGGDDGDDGAADTGDDTTTSATAMTASDSGPTAPFTMTDASASASSSGADDGPAESETGASASSGPDEGDPSSGGASSDEGGKNSCTPDGADDPCRECVKANCCDDWIACANDDVCACTIDCHLGGSSLGSCKNQCGGDPETYDAVYFCGQMFCLGTCDWDCC